MSQSCPGGGFPSRRLGSLGTTVPLQSNTGGVHMGPSFLGNTGTDVSDCTSLWAHASSKELWISALPWGLGFPPPFPNQQLLPGKDGYQSFRG